MTDPIPLIDLTSLEPDDDREVAERLCAQAVTPRGSVAAVCVMPHLVGPCRELLEDSAVLVATVANFPGGAADPEAAAGETRAAVLAGAQEVDVVAPWRAAVAGADQAVHLLVAACLAECGELARLKVILETGSHPDLGATRAMADAALEAGAAFVKTSTGKHGPGASPEAAQVLLEAVRDHGRGGVKVSGGVRTADQAHGYVAQAARVLGTEPGPASFRIGASSLLDALLAE